MIRLEVSSVKFTYDTSKQNPAYSISMRQGFLGAFLLGIDTPYTCATITSVVYGIYLQYFSSPEPTHPQILGMSGKIFLPKTPFWGKSGRQWESVEKCVTLLTAK
jgi:hypothetical protein